MKKLYFLIIASYCFAPAIAQSVEKKFVTIAGTLVNAGESTPRVMEINFLNPFMQERRAVIFDSLGQFSAKGEMLFSQNMTVLYNGTFINLYVVPGDSVDLQIDASLLDRPQFAWLTIKGDHADISTQLNNWYEFAMRMPSKEYDMTMSPQAMIDSIRADHNERLVQLESYASKHHVDPIIKNWAGRDLKYLISNQVVDYTDLNTSDTTEITSRQLLFENAFFEPYEPENFQTMMFPYHLYACLYGLLKQDTLIENLKLGGNIKEAATRGIHLLSSRPAGLCRDFMLFSFLSKLIQKSPDLLDSLSTISRSFSSQIGFNYLEEMARLEKNPVYNASMIAGISYIRGMEKVDLPETDLIDYLAKKYQGKIIYIDVYATWCSPCHREMTYMGAVHERLKDENVAYINLCLRSDEQRWLSFVREKQPAGENFFLNSDATKLFMSGYQIQGFPSYLLIDGKGRVATLHAPRPSETEELYRKVRQIAAR